MAIARTTQPLPDDVGASKQQNSSYVDIILEVVDAIPKGKVLSYGDVAELAGVPSARQVGRVLSHVGSEHPWHRVVMADGSMAPNLVHAQAALLIAERTPFKLGRHRIDMARARWNGVQPTEHAPDGYSGDPGRMKPSGHRSPEIGSVE